MGECLVQVILDWLHGYLLKDCQRHFVVCQACLWLFSSLLCLKKLLAVHQCVQKAALVSRWTRANLKQIDFKCWNGAFDVWRIHITHLHILGLCSAHHPLLPFYFLCDFPLHFTLNNLYTLPNQNLHAQHIHSLRGQLHTQTQTLSHRAVFIWL